MFYPNITTWGWRVAAISKNVTDIHFFVIQGGVPTERGEGQGRNKQKRHRHTLFRQSQGVPTDLLDLKIP